MTLGAVVAFPVIESALAEAGAVRVVPGALLGLAAPYVVLVDRIDTLRAAIARLEEREALERDLEEARRVEQRAEVDRYIAALRAAAERNP